MNTQPKPTVFLVDDDPATLRTLRKALQSLGLKAVAYSSAEAFLEAYQPSGPGCLVLDVRLPGMSGLELQQRLRATGGILPIIFVTAHADVPTAVKAMEKGAFWLLQKPFRVKELCDKIQKAVALARKNWQRHQKRQAAQRRLAALTPAERRVLDFVVAGKANKATAEALGISVRTVEVHRARIMKKLKMKSRAELLKLVGAAAPEHRPSWLSQLNGVSSS
jgi:FixJ family two-component response regulator